MVSACWWWNLKMCGYRTSYCTNPLIQRRLVVEALTTLRFFYGQMVYTLGLLLLFLAPHARSRSSSLATPGRGKPPWLTVSSPDTSQVCSVAANAEVSQKVGSNTVIKRWHVLLLSFHIKIFLKLVSKNIFCAVMQFFLWWKCFETHLTNILSFHIYIQPFAQFTDWFKFCFGCLPVTRFLLIWF